MGTQPKELPQRNRPVPPIETLSDPANERARSLIAYWTASHGDGGALPDRTAFAPEHLRPWLGHISIYRTVDDGADFLITLDGTEIVEMTGEDWTGRRTSEIDAVYGTDLTGLMHGLVESGRPCAQRVGLIQKRWASATRVSLPVARCDEAGGYDVVMAIFLD